MKNFFHASPLALFLLPLLVVTGCSDSSNDEGTGETSDTLTACGDYFDALQSIGPRCLNGAPLDSDFESSQRDGFLKTCEYTIALPGTASGFVSSLASCAKKLGTLSCEVLLDEDDPCGLSDEAGTRAAGEACEESVQCASGSCTAGGSSCGTCAEKIADGGACDDDTKVCGDDSTCAGRDSESSTGTCEARKKAGAACEETDLCARGLECSEGACKAVPKLGDACEGRCAGLAFCSESVCTALPKVGEACLGEYGVCEYGLKCNETNQKCEKRAAPSVAIGGACDDDALFCKEGYCNQATSEDDSGVCTAYGKLGAACNDERGLQCEIGLRCTDAKCVELTPICK